MRNKLHSAKHEEDNKNHVSQDCHNFLNIHEYCQCDSYQDLDLCSRCEKEYVRQ